MLSYFGKGILLFSSEKIGEFAYELELGANELPPTQLPFMTAAVGKYDVRKLYILVDSDTQLVD